MPDVLMGIWREVCSNLSPQKQGSQVQFLQAAKTYLTRLHAQYGVMQVLGQNEPQWVEDQILLPRESARRLDF